MRTISNKEARKNPIYRDIMAAALWQYRNLKGIDCSLFEYVEGKPRNLTFLSSAYFMIYDSVEYDRKTGHMTVTARFHEAPKWRTIMIFE